MQTVRFARVDPPRLSPALREDLRSTYRFLHRHPELSMQEHRTARYLEERLADAGLDVFRCAETGVVGVLENGPGRVVAYRADMDGLPVREKTGLAFASRETGTLDGAEVPVMHACGHDVHMSVALAAIDVLIAQRDEWSGTVVAIFQPAEETATGARAMIADGLWSRAPKPAVILGQHVMPYESGKVFVPLGPAMSMADSLRITVHGRGSHGSQPEESIDPIVIASAIVMRLQTIVAREISPREAAVVTVGTFHAGVKENVIPDHAVLTVNLRAFTDTVRQKMLSAVERIVAGEAAAAGAPMPVIERISDFPLCYNEPDAARSLVAGLTHALGEGNAEVCPAHMGSEDFGHLGAAIDVPTLYWFLGGTSADDLGEGRPVNHSPHFAPAEDPTLETGVSAALTAILGALRAP